MRGQLTRVAKYTISQVRLRILCWGGRCRLPSPTFRAAGRGELRSAAGRRHRLPHHYHHRIRNRICDGV